MAIRLAFHQVSSLALLHIECVPSEIKEILFMHAGTKPEKNLGDAEQKNRGFFYLLLTLAPPT